MNPDALAAFPLAVALAAEAALRAGATIATVATWTWSDDGTRCATLVLAHVPAEHAPALIGAGFVPDSRAVTWHWAVPRTG